MDPNNTITDSYDLAAFGENLGESITIHNPYRGVYPERLVRHSFSDGGSRRGGAWGYMTDPSGLLQLGARFYWPEVGRFIQQDPIRDGVNWYAYVGSNPVVWIDPDGLDLTIPGLSGQAFLVFDEGSGAQLGMSAGATLSGLAAGATLGLWQPDWTDPCDPYAGFSKGMGTMSGGALAAAAGAYASGLSGFKVAGGGLHPAHHTFRIGRHTFRAPHVDMWVRRSMRGKPWKFRIPIGRPRR